MTCTRPLRKLGLRKPLPPCLEGFGGGSHLMGCCYPCHYHMAFGYLHASLCVLPLSAYWFPAQSCGAVARPSNGGKNLQRSLAQMVDGSPLQAAASLHPESSCSRHTELAVGWEGEVQEAERSTQPKHSGPRGVGTSLGSTWLGSTWLQHSTPA